MKKLFALLLALVMVLSLAACGGGDEDKTPSSSDTPPSSGQQTQQPSNTPDPGTSEPDNSGANEPYIDTDNQTGVFLILDRYDVFPTSEYWTEIGLPADLSIEIESMDFSSTSSIYPQDFEEANMLECTVADKQAAYTALTDTLWNAGINGMYPDGGVNPATDRTDIESKGGGDTRYTAYWEFDGELMCIELSIRDTPAQKVTITIKYKPEV